MAIELNSPLWDLLADWVKILLTLPDPAPEPLVAVSDLVALTAINALAQRLSPQLSGEMRQALAPMIRKATAAQMK
jgi:hypothetical protein